MTGKMGLFVSFGDDCHIPLVSTWMYHKSLQNYHQQLRSCESASDFTCTQSPRRWI